MTHRVFSFVGQNANGILSWWSQKILDRLAEFGVTGVLFELGHPNFQKQLAAAMSAGKPTMGLSFQGFGLDLNFDTGNMWDVLDIPFVSTMGDAPYHAPMLNARIARRQALLYTNDDFFDTYQRFFPQASFAGMLPFGFPANPHVADIAPSMRRNEIVFVKTGVDPAGFVGRWSEIPARLRGVLIDAATTVLSGSDQTIARVCEQAFEAHRLIWGHRPEFFYRVCAEVDMYTRAVRADLMARHLMRHDAIIYGDWDYLDKSSSRASFRGRIPASDLHRLYANTRILVNTSPSVRSGVHERIMSGMLSKCCVLSDRTPFLDRELGTLPSFAGIDIDHATVGDQVDAALDLLRQGPDVETAYRFASVSYSVDRFVGELLQFIEIEQFGQRSGFYRPFTSVMRHAPERSAA